MSENMFENGSRIRTPPPTTGKHQDSRVSIYLYRLIVASRSYNETWSMDTRDILSSNVNEQLMMVIQNGCEVNREQARICSAVL